MVPELEVEAAAADDDAPLLSEEEELPAVVFSPSSELSRRKGSCRVQ